MGVGREIIKEQRLFRKELRERVFWFVRLRWLAAGAGGLALAAAKALGLGLPFIPLAVVIAGLLGLNLTFHLVGRWLEESGKAGERSFQIFAHAQISLDLLALFALIHLTGGPASILIIFLIFHVILAGILLSPASCYFYAGVILAALAGIMGLHRAGLTPAAGTSAWLLEPRPGDGALLLSNLSFAVGIVVAAYLITTVKTSLQMKGRELMRTSKELDISNAKLTSLYEMIREVGSLTSFQNLLDAATRNAARIMGVKACSIKLLDPVRNCLRFASTYGLSQDYLTQECISVEKSAVNRRIIEGSLYSIGRIGEESYFQYPENIRKENIASMLCLPLKADGRTLGVFCVYSSEPDYFHESDAGFFSLMTELTAMAMSRLSQEKARTWFLNKAAHQLRAPINAVMSLLRLISGGYLGPASDKQLETVGRCETRLKVLAEIINDLLKLTAQRHEAEVGRALRPVDAGRVLDILLPMFRAQAGEKGVRLKLDLPDSLPLIMGRENLIDELFSNLVSNAIKYTPAGGEITIRQALAEDEALLFEVSDTGIGISEDDQAKLFSEFFRGENAKALVEEGTGIGLVIVKEILDLLNGPIAIESRLGRGTKVTCRLPLARN